MGGAFTGGLAAAVVVRGRRLAARAGVPVAVLGLRLGRGLGRLLLVLLVVLLVRHLLGGARGPLRTEQVVELRRRLPVVRRTGRARPDPVRGSAGHRRYVLRGVRVAARLRWQTARDGSDVLRGVGVTAGDALTGPGTGFRRQRLRVRLGLVGLLGLVLLRRVLLVLLLVRVGVLRLLRLLGLLVRPCAALAVRRVVSRCLPLALAVRLLPLPLRGRQRLRLLLRVPVRYRRLGAQLRRGVGLRPPGLAPRLPARRDGLAGRLPALVGLAVRGCPRDPGGTAVGGQHDTFVRGPSGGELLLAALSALSALRHRDSYV
ncbi:conserved protein of unknown function [Streptomyces sp. KY75]|nr:conserved protein of unknown function [Streptomyces sp. KY70]CAD5980417.1 conserved protein of unknown function [Streptomyces sp. KY75]